ncbi:MAG: FRG domain-containing protein [Dechloromonas sp.]|uniref:FRG domain-containing protein n=1 Tax=Candidatus Dechloromonas phosphorivorans TaxID=2899244 RepID=A0A9D7QKM0_9RHOO|nr:FRG domain-containing protein [Candidatus Dechloromonas phosphorivorans]
MLDLGEAHSLSDLLEAAHIAEQRLGGQVWFRGHAKKDWQLVPSAHRRHPVLESQFAHHFRLRAPSLATNCPGHKDYVGWLPLMQHYGLPTRLLDWTESLMVAAFFAVPSKSNTSSAALWLLAPGTLNKQSIGHVIPFLVDARVTPLVTSAFSGRINPEEQNSVAVLAPRTDRRMAAQLGNYTIHGGREPLEAHPASSQFLARVLIPVTAHDKIRADLSVSGIRLSSIFPDLSNLAMEITEIRAFGHTDDDLE